MEQPQERCSSARSVIWPVQHSGRVAEGLAVKKRCQIAAGSSARTRCCPRAAKCARSSTKPRWTSRPPTWPTVCTRCQQNYSLRCSAESKHRHTHRQTRVEGARPAPTHYGRTCSHGAPCTDCIRYCCMCGGVGFMFHEPRVWHESSVRIQSNFQEPGTGAGIESAVGSSVAEVQH